MEEREREERQYATAKKEQELREEYLQSKAKQDELHRTVREQHQRQNAANKVQELTPMREEQRKAEAKQDEDREEREREDRQKATEKEEQEKGQEHSEQIYYLELELQRARQAASDSQAELKRRDEVMQRDSARVSDLSFYLPNNPNTKSQFPNPKL